MEHLTVVLSSQYEEVCGCVYIENSDLGMHAQVNIFNNGYKGLGFKVLISDDDGCAVVKYFCSDYIMIKLPEHFSIGGKVYVEVCRGAEVVMNGQASSRNFLDLKMDKLWNCGDNAMTAKEWAELNDEMNVYEEAVVHINKFKSSTCAADFCDFHRNDTCFWDTICSDFAFCFNNFEADKLLSAAIKNSRWVKLENYSLGILYDKNCDFEFDCKQPKYIAIAYKVLDIEEDNVFDLGKFSSLVYLKNLKLYYRILLQDAKTGKAVKILRNKC